MAQKSLDMNQAKQVQQLSADGISIKEIVRRTGISRKTVRKYLRKMAAAFPVLDEIDVTSISDTELANIIYEPDPAPVTGIRFRQAVNHFDIARQSLHKTGVTKQLLWAEYLEANPGGYSYSQYCFLFKQFLKETDPAFHWTYNPGEFTQVDFAGKKLFYTDKTGQKIHCEVFVGVLPYSGLIFCTAVQSQRIPDFAFCINALLKYVGGVTKTILCDNLKTAVTKADKYEPAFTELCHRLSAHYTTTFSATRPREPTDKGMVEGAVRIVYNHIYGPMYKYTAHSLEDLNAQITSWLNVLNSKPYKGTKESRRDIFQRDEQPILKLLPEAPYKLQQRKTVTVQRNYAIQLPDNKHYYTVPYQYVGKKVIVYFDSRTVEVYYQYERIAFHGRNTEEPRFNRIHDHMPVNHQYVFATQGWSVDELLMQAEKVGKYTRQAADRLLHSSIYPEQNYKACNAMLALQYKFSRHRLEAACVRAANVTRPTLSMIRAILQTGLDKQPLLFDNDDSKPIHHGNIRGSNNYQ
jgi:transposase